METEGSIWSTGAKRMPDFKVAVKIMPVCRGYSELAARFYWRITRTAHVKFHYVNVTADNGKGFEFNPNRTQYRISIVVMVISHLRRIAPDTTGLDHTK